MRRFHVILSALATVLTTGASFADAGRAPKKEEQWAQCLWTEVPQSAANWLSMASGLAKSDDSRKKSPAELLEYRLQAACYEKLTVPGKKFPIGFSASKVRNALATSKPATIGEDTVEPKAYQCVRFFSDDTEMKNPAAYKWGFGDFETGPAFASLTFFFAAKGGGAVGLPEAGGLRKCQWISSEGTLTDA